MAGQDGMMGAMLGFVSDAYNNGENRSFATEQGKKQYQRQRKLNQQGKDLALEMWNDTNYEAQMKHMMKAGVNPNTIYGGSGAGGATASTGSGGSAPSVQAQGSNSATSAGIGQMAQMGMMNTQEELMKAQKENVEANTNKTNIEASNIEEPITAGVSKTLADRDKAKAETEGKQIENEVTGDTREESKQQVKAQANKTTGEARSAMTQGEIDTATREARIGQLKAESVGAGLENILKLGEQQLQGAQKQAIQQSIRKMQAEVSQGWQSLRQDEKRIMIQRFVENLKAEYPSIMNVTGRTYNEIQKEIEKLTGSDYTNARQIK